MTLVVAFLLAAQHFHSGATVLEPALQDADPVAVVKTILVNGAELTEAAQTEMKVTRLSAEVQGGQTGMLLVPGDEIGTGPNAKVTLLFLDAAPERGNEVVIDSNAQMRVGSIFNLLGRVLVRSKGRFEAATQRVKLEEAGTEYELVVQPDGTNRIRILDGTLRVQKGSFSPGTTRNDSRRSDGPVLADGGVNFLHSSFDTQTTRRPRPAESLSRPGKMEFVAIRGTTTSFERDFVFTNRCNLKHQYEIRGPINMTWFRIMGANIFELDGRETSSISFAMRADATRVPIGVYEGEIRARCLDCTQEQGCDVGGLSLDISVSVIAAGGRPVETPSPEGTPTLRVVRPSRQVSPQVSPPVNQTATVAQELQQVILGPDGALNRTGASDAEIDETLNWSNDIIIASQPTYPAQSVIPHLQSWQERAQQFRTARRGAILNNDPNGYEALGRIYVEWGNGAKAVDELRKAVNASQTAERMTGLGEAYRLIGDLRSAQTVLRRTVSQYPDYAPGLNALGNVYLDRGKAAQDQRDYESARTQLNVARQHYERAKIYSTAFIVAESNIAETELTLGDIARDQGRLEEAMNQYKQAEQTFTRVEQTSRSSVFVTKGFGDVYRRMSGVARIQGNTVFAQATFARSQDRYRQALQSNRDMSESFIGLGKLYEENGYKDRAIASYGQAIRVRPEVPQGYYHYALAIAERNPGSAAAYAKAFLKLEREPLKQGEKAGNARQVAVGRPVSFPTTPTVTPTPITVVTPTPVPSTPTPTPISTASPVKVPDVGGKKRDDALKKLRERGLEAQFRDQPDCDASGKVVATDPRKDTKVPQGFMVTVYISSTGEDAVTVPSVTNQQLEDAQRELQRLGFVVDTRTRRTNDVPENTVLSQKPAANRQLKRGCEVELTISKRIPLIPVPNFIGLSRQEALRQLQRISFGGVIRGSVTEVDSKGPPGIVVDQSPKPGVMVEPGTPVDLYISRSQYGDEGQGQPNYAVVPPLYGRTLDQVKSILADAHLKLGKVDTIPAKANDPVDVVVNQSPKPHQKVPVGSSVNVVISYILIK